MTKRRSDGTFLSRVFRRGASAPRDTVHMLHISKTAGSHMRKIAEAINVREDLPQIVSHHHETGLIDLPPDAPYFFGTRDPVSRFHAGFYSSKRWLEKQHKASRWIVHSQQAFSDFAHSNDLAEALFDPGSTGLKAVAAMRSIRHPSRNLVDTFSFLGNLFDLRPPVWILRQEHFDADLDTLLSRLNIPKSVVPVIPRTHTTNYDGIPPLSDLAQKNLRRWYEQDYQFLRLCDDWMARSQSSTQTASAGSADIATENQAMTNQSHRNLAIQY